MTCFSVRPIGVTSLLCLALVGCNRPGRERLCEQPMDLTPPYISEAEIAVAPTSPDDDAQIQIGVTLQAGYNCDPETLELCAVRLVDRTSGEVLVELDVGFPEDFDGQLDCPEAEILELVDHGTRNSALTTACLREVDLAMEICSVECPDHSWIGSGRANLDCSH